MIILVLLNYVVSKTVWMLSSYLKQLKNRSKMTNGQVNFDSEKIKNNVFSVISSTNGFPRPPFLHTDRTFRSTFEIFL